MENGLSAELGIFKVRICAFFNTSRHTGSPTFN